VSLPSTSLRIASYTKNGTSNKNAPASNRCAIRSLCSFIVRAPVNRQITIIDAKPSTKDEAAHTITLKALAFKPAISPTTPSTVIHASENHDSARARRASRSHRSSRRGGWLGSVRLTV
jgi:hypothetical protein